MNVMVNYSAVGLPFMHRRINLLLFFFTSFRVHHSASWYAIASTVIQIIRLLLVVLARVVLLIVVGICRVLYSCTCY